MVSEEAIFRKFYQFSIAVALLLPAACDDAGLSGGLSGGLSRWMSYGVGYGCCGPVYALGAGLPTYRLAPHSYWSYPDYHGTAPGAGPIAVLEARRTGESR